METQVIPYEFGKALAPVAPYLTLVSLELPPGLSYEEWAELSHGLKMSGRMVKNKSQLWWVGDWLNYGEKEMGEAYSQAYDLTGYDLGTLANAKYVASRIKPGNRRYELSWSHHRIVAKLEEGQQAVFLEKAINEDLSASELGRLVDADGVIEVDPGKPKRGRPKKQKKLPSTSECARAVSDTLGELVSLTNNVRIALANIEDPDIRRQLSGSFREFSNDLSKLADLLESSAPQEENSEE